MTEHSGENRHVDGTRIVRIRCTSLNPTDDQSVLLRDDEQVVAIKPSYEPDGVHLDVFIVDDWRSVQSYTKGYSAASSQVVSLADQFGRSGGPGAR